MVSWFLWFMIGKNLVKLICYMVIINSLYCQIIFPVKGTAKPIEKWNDRKAITSGGKGKYYTRINGIWGPGGKKFL